MTQLSFPFPVEQQFKISLQEPKTLLWKTKSKAAVAIDPNEAGIGKSHISQKQGESEKQIKAN